MPFFPMFIDLKDKPVLIAGGGSVALRKLEKLSPYGGKMAVVAPDILPGIADFPDVKLKRRGFKASDLRPRPALVIAATDSREVNRRISRLCRNRHIPVNVADDPALCSFLFPALVHQGAFSAGISTGGASPVAAAYFKERIKELLPEGLEGLLLWLESLRPAVKAAVPEQSRRGEIFRRLFEAGMAKGAPLTWEETGRYIAGEAQGVAAAEKDAAGEARSVAAAEKNAAGKAQGIAEAVKDTFCGLPGSVALVGAGCGKADLITLRGLRLLRQCQAVVYDDLIDEELLDAAPESAERIYVGKRSGVHAASQEEINQRLIALARSGLKVVRLKGGDPYLFGRGGEEMTALKAAGIFCQEVPGIPSPMGIAAEAGIPVTHRGISRSLHIVTAHTADTKDGLLEDFDALAKLSGTLVFLMGLAHLPVIAARLIAAGKDPKTPSAVISGGNAPNPACVRASLDAIAQAAENACVSAPAIILVGGVAVMDLSADGESRKESLEEICDDGGKGALKGARAGGWKAPLKGVRVGLTGTPEIEKKQRVALQVLGAETVWAVRSEIKELPGAYDWRRLSANSDWLVFTSANGVRACFRQVAEAGQMMEKDMDFLKGKKFSVIGAATGAALARYGIDADVCPDTYTSEHLASAIAAVAKPGERVTLLRSALATKTLPEMLQKSGFVVEDIPVYDLESSPGAARLPKLDYLTFSSAGGVESFFKQYGAVPEGVCCVCIGSVTAKALEQHTDAYFLTASEISAEGIVEAILHDWESRRRPAG